MLKLIRPVTLAAAALTLSVLGGTGVAVANAGGSEGAADQTAQDAACKTAGVDPSASNINYDDETGVCSLDEGDDGETND